MTWLDDFGLFSFVCSRFGFFNIFFDEGVGGKHQMKEGQGQAEQERQCRR